MNYRNQLSQKVEDDFQRFRQSQFNTSIEQVFENAFMIDTLTEVHSYLTDEVFYLDEDVCKYLCEQHNILEFIFDEYMKNKDFAPITEWNGLLDMLYDLHEKNEIEM